MVSRVEESHRHAESSLLGEIARCLTRLIRQIWIAPVQEQQSHQQSVA